MNRLIKAVSAAVVLSLLLSICGFAGECARIREQVLRLHVLAHSDSEEDQQLKLKVRDAVIGAAQGLFDGAANEGEALALAREQLSTLEEAARECVRAEGYSYEVTVSLCHMYFTTRHYEGADSSSITLPAGMYDALRITIGEGKGKNWWCMVFPPLCVSAAEQSAALDDVLDPVQQDIVTQPQKYEVRFKAVELFEGLCRQIGSWFGQPESTSLE
ncbi:MAG: stage II sporulation protein R [Clostridiales bacterium]|nr:stage II sporulation protein R [Clostridiales bacterium]